jgi:hypothetical protein
MSSDHFITGVKQLQDCQRPRFAASAQFPQTRDKTIIVGCEFMVKPIVSTGAVWISKIIVL